MNAVTPRSGHALALTAFTLWGLFPLYFRQLGPVDPLVVLCHRALWAGAAAAVLLLAFRRAGLLAWLRGGSVGRDLRSLALTAALLASNWCAFLLAVARGEVLQSSLGYFMSPLLAVALGVVVLRERLTAVQKVAFALGSVGLVVLASLGDGFPWLGLYLAGSFGVYGLLRKRLVLDALLASGVEVLLMAPAAGLALMLVGPADLAFDTRTSTLLVLSGPLTAVPLVLYAAAVRSLPYSAIGLAQYLTPCLQLLVAVLVFGEPLGLARLLAFGCVAAALLVTSVHAAVRARRPAHMPVLRPRGPCERPDRRALFGRARQPTPLHLWKPTDDARHAGPSPAR